MGWYKKFLIDRIMCGNCMSEEIFFSPKHPYTRALLSAIPVPDPILESYKKLEVYDVAKHEYSIHRPMWVEIEPDHYVLGNLKELDEYRRRLR